MNTFTFRQLIDLAIGSPEPGHVNFYALHCLLFTLTEKLHITDESVDCSKFSKISLILGANSKASATANIAATSTTSNKTAVSEIPNKKIRISSEVASKASSIRSATVKTSSAGKISGGKTNNIKSPTSEFSSNKVIQSARSAVTNSKDNTKTTSSRLTQGNKKFSSHYLFDDINKDNRTRLAGGVDDETEAAKKDATAEEASAKEAPAEGAAAEEAAAEEAAAEEAAAEEAIVKQSPEPEAAPESVSAPDRASARKVEELPVEAPTEAMVEAQPEVPADVGNEKRETEGADAQPGAEQPQDDAEKAILQEQEAFKSQVENIKNGVAIMKDQIEVAMQQVDVLTHSLLNSNLDGIEKMDKYLRSLSEKLKLVQNANTFIEGVHRFHLEPTASELSVEHLSEEEEELGSLSQKSDESAEPQESFDLEQPLVYSAEKLLDLMIQLKSDFCALTNRVNALSASILEQDCQRTMRTLNEVQEELAELKASTETLNERQERLETKQSNTESAIVKIKDNIFELNDLKIDKTEVQLLLAEKADYKQLSRKISQEQFMEFQCRLEKQFCEVYKLMNVGEKNIKTMIENMRQSLGFDNIDEVFKRYKENTEQQVHSLAETLQKYIESTNDDCAAAGARVKVLQDLACISCDTTCVMRSIEKAKVAKLQSAHASPTYAPLVTYELGNIRKSGLMGYYRKDEFPNAPNAWMGHQLAGMKSCVPRHAGGPHTITTAKDKMEKIQLLKK